MCAVVLYRPVPKQLMCDHGTVPMEDNPCPSLFGLKLFLGCERFCGLHAILSSISPSLSLKLKISYKALIGRLALSQHLSQYGTYLYQLYFMSHTKIFHKNYPYHIKDHQDVETNFEHLSWDARLPKDTVLHWHCLELSLSPILVRLPHGRP